LIALMVAEEPILDVLAVPLAMAAKKKKSKKKAKTSKKKAVKKAIKKSGKKAKKGKKTTKRKGKKKKKAAKKKLKVTRDAKGRRKKGARKTKAQKAAGKRSAAAMKKKGVGIFATKNLSADLAAICGKNKMPRTEVTKAVWKYIKKHKLNDGRTIKPDATLKKVCPSASFSMFKMPGMLSKHIK